LGLKQRYNDMLFDRRVHRCIRGVSSRGNIDLLFNGMGAAAAFGVSFDIVGKGFVDMDAT
jgi:hypothetical protein